MVTISWSLSWYVADAHPLCWYDSRPTDYDEVLTFCPESQAGACCNDLEEAEILALFDSAGTLTAECQAYYKQVVCGVCHSYSAHLYEILGAELGGTDGMTMKNSFCNELIAACEGQIDFPSYDGLDYCDKHTGGGDDKYWSYPYTEPNVAESGLTDVFSVSLPDNPMALHMSPDGSVWWIAGLSGLLIEVPADSKDTSSAVMDLADSSEFYVDFEEGLIDFAFGPIFSSNNRFYVSYSVVDAVGGVHNRLSKFESFGAAALTLASEEVYVESSTRSAAIHAGGWVGFKPSDYGSGTSHDLYWSNGDSGPQEDTDEHGQNIDDIHATIVRITVPTTGDGYTIPSGNIVGGLPEICAYGFRNPFRCAFDRETDELYCGDVGHTLIESVYMIECGKNYGWSRFEGSRCQEAVEARLGPCDGVDRSGFEFPIFEYCHPDYDSSLASEDAFTGGVDICAAASIRGNAIIGGHVYRGQFFSEVLGGAYVFGDQQNRNIYYMVNEGGKWEVGTIIGDGSVAVISFAEDNNGELYVVTQDERIFALPCGELCMSFCLEQADSIPTYESLGCYADTADRALTLAEGVCPENQRAMSPSICAAYCATIPGATLFGLQFSYQCFCGSATDDYEQYGSLPSADCMIPCTSFPDEVCGGFSAMEVFSMGAD